MKKLLSTYSLRIPAELKIEMDRHPEINWDAVFSIDIKKTLKIDDEPLDERIFTDELITLIKMFNS